MKVILWIGFVIGLYGIYVSGSEVLSVALDSKATIYHQIYARIGLSASLLLCLLAIAAHAVIAAIERSSAERATQHEKEMFKFAAMRDFLEMQTEILAEKRPAAASPASPENASQQSHSGLPDALRFAAQRATRE